MAQDKSKTRKPRSGRPPIRYPDAAQYLGCTESQLKRWVAEGRIEHIKLTPTKSGRVMFDPDRLDEFIEAHSVPASS